MTQILTQLNLDTAVPAHSKLDCEIKYSGFGILEEKYFAYIIGNGIKKLLDDVVALSQENPEEFLEKGKGLREQLEKKKASNVNLKLITNDEN